MLRHLKFTQQNETKVAKKTADIGNYQDCVKIKTIEVRTPTPSEVTMTMKKTDLNGVRTQEIYFADYRTRFLFQNGIYILDTKQMSEFNDVSLWHLFEISFKALNSTTPIEIDVFYTLENTPTWQSLL